MGLAAVAWATGAGVWVGANTGAFCRDGCTADVSGRLRFDSTGCRELACPDVAAIGAFAVVSLLAITTHPPIIANTELKVSPVFIQEMRFR